MRRRRIGRGVPLLGVAACVLAAEARATSAVVTSVEVQTFLGGRTGKIVFVDKADDKAYYVNLTDMSITKLSDDVSVDSPLFSPDGTRVCYEIGKTGVSYIRLLSGGSAIPLLGSPAHQPHWYEEDSTEYIIHCSSLDKDYDPDPGVTRKQRLFGDSTPDGSPTVIWADRGMDSGLTPDGRWLGEAYGNSFCVDLVAGKEYSRFYKADGSIEDQTCNGSMCPDDTGRYMSLLIPHERFRTWIHNPSLDRWEELRSFELPTGRIEVQQPEWSTHPEFCTATACTAARNDYDVYIINTADGNYLKVLTGDLGYPHLWVDPNGVNSDPFACLTADRTSGAPSLAASFEAVSGDPEGDALTHEWDWEYSGTFVSDEDTGAAKTASHAYDSLGDYTAAVRVSDGQGHSVVDTLAITVANPSRCGTGAIAFAALLVFAGLRRRRS